MRRKKRIQQLRMQLFQKIDKQSKGRKQYESLYDLENKKQEMKQKDLERRHNLVFQQTGEGRKTEYSEERARLIAQMIQQIKTRVTSGDGVSFIQQYYITKGLKVFGDRGHEAAMKELKQLVERNCWKPIDVGKMTPSEKQKAVDAMMLLAKKNDGTIKGRCVFKGSETRDWLSRENTASPTASLEGICSTCVIDAHEERDVMTVDIPNAGRIYSKIQRRRDTRNSGRYQSIGIGKRGENRSPKARNLPLFCGEESISVKTSQIGYCSNCSYPCISSKGTQSKRLAQINSIDALHQFDKRQTSDIECR